MLEVAHALLNSRLLSYYTIETLSKAMLPKILYSKCFPNICGNYDWRILKGSHHFECGFTVTRIMMHLGYKIWEA